MLLLNKVFDTEVDQLVMPRVRAKWDEMVCSCEAARCWNQLTRDQICLN